MIKQCPQPVETKERKEMKKNTKIKENERKVIEIKTPSTDAAKHHPYHHHRN